MALGWSTSPASRYALAFVVGLAAGAVGWHLVGPSLLEHEQNDPAARAVAPRVEPGLPSADELASMPRELSAQRALADGELQTALDLAETELAEHPRRSWALMVSSRVWERRGGRFRAIAPLLTILDYPEDLEIVARTRARMDLLIAAHTRTAIERGRIVDAAALYEAVVARQPHEDRYRFEHARLLAAMGDFPGARLVLATVADNGVAPDAIAALARQIESRSTVALADDLGIPFPTRIDDRRIVATVLIDGRALQLLVDTGASITGINHSLLREIRVRRISDGMRVGTVAGPTNLPVYRVRDVDVGELRIDVLDVVALESEMTGLDGILGMDILERTGFLK